MALFPTIADVESGQSMLFVGAGFSTLAKNQDGQPVKSAFALMSYLLEQCNITDLTDYDLDSAAEEYVSSFSVEALTRVLQSNFHCSAVTMEQRIIAAQPWYRIYTTNYDDVIERCLTESRKPYTTRDVSDSAEHPQNGITQIVHIYGSINKSSPDEFRKNFILTERQRDNSPFLTSPWHRRFSDDVLTMRSTTYAGFSMKDIDLRRTLGLLPNTQGRTFFVESPFASRPTQTRLKKLETSKYPVCYDRGRDRGGLIGSQRVILPCCGVLR